MRRHLAHRFKLSTLACLAIAATCLLGAAPSGAAVATTSIATDPGLSPSFSTSVSDYVTRCTGSPVRVTVNAPSNTRSSVDSQPARKGTYTTTVALSSGQEFRVSVDAPATKSDTAYYVRCLPSDFPGFSSQRPGQPQADYYTVAPFNRADFQPFPSGVSSSYVAIFDNDGAPVWWEKASSHPTDFHFISNGHVLWTNSSYGVPAEEHALDGSLARSINAVDAPIDQHEALLLSNGNYIVMAYKPRCCYDLTPYGGPSDATIVDNEIQEITPAGAEVWEWRAADHIPLSEVPSSWWPYILRPQVQINGAWDVFHMNSIESTGGDLVISFRHLDAIYRINRDSGDVIWKIGGNPRAESLTVVGDTIQSGKPLQGQHDARVLSDGTVTVHDNGYQFSISAQRKPRAIRYRIDTSAKTATVVEQVTDPGNVNAGCCGSARKLPGGDWVAQWGQNDGVHELTASGSLVFSLTFDNNLFSYRAHPVLPGFVSRTALRAGMDAQYPR